MLATDSATPFDVTITANDGGSHTVTTMTIDNTKVYTANVPPTAFPIGVKIAAAYDFVAYSMHIGGFSCDGTLLFPLDALGTDYVVLGVTYSRYAAYVYIIAAFDDTIVSLFYPNGSKGLYSANELDVVQLPFYNDSTGTKISSTFPVAVLVGSSCLYFPTGCTGCDVAMEQVILARTINCKKSTCYQHKVAFSYLRFLHSA